MTAQYIQRIYDAYIYIYVYNYIHIVYVWYIILDVLDTFNYHM